MQLTTCPLHLTPHHCALRFRKKFRQSWRECSHELYKKETGVQTKLFCQVGASMECFLSWWISMEFALVPTTLLPTINYVWVVAQCHCFQWQHLWKHRTIQGSFDVAIGAVIPEVIFRTLFVCWLPLNATVFAYSQNSSSAGKCLLGNVSSCPRLKPIPEILSLYSLVGKGRHETNDVFAGVEFSFWLNLSTGSWDLLYTVIKFFTHPYPSVDHKWGYLHGTEVKREQSVSGDE